MVATPVSLVTQDVASPVAPPAEVNARRGYGFLNVSTSPDTAARLSGENVSSMFVMTEPIATEAAAPESTDKSTATAALQSDEAAPAPAPKPKPQPKPIATRGCTAGAEDGDCAEACRTGRARPARHRAGEC